MYLFLVDTVINCYVDKSLNDNTNSIELNIFNMT